MSVFRQQFMTAQHYSIIIEHLDGEEDFWRKNTLQAESAEQEKSVKARKTQRASFGRLVARYTGGEDIELLQPLLVELIESYERYQVALAQYESVPNISPLALEDWDYQFEECVQVISLCILMHKSELLERFVLLFDRAGFAGQDTLYEDLLRPCLPNRHDVDEWYYDVYTPLIHAIYEKDKGKKADALKKYCREWYPSFENAPWYDTHLDGDDGAYIGYWAFEAGAIAYLYDIDDSKVDHMSYPADLVSYARKRQPTSADDGTSKLYAGQICTRSGYWYSPAQKDSLRFFSLGDVMPEFKGSPWGDTIWYWSGER